MKTFYNIFLFTFFVSTAFAQQEKYSRIKVWLTNKSITELASLGIDVTEGIHRPGVWFITEMSQTEFGKVKQANFKTDIIVDDVKTHRIQQTPSPKRVAAFSCATASVPEYPQPQNFTLGSMGGFFTYQEMLDMLDSMASKYPNLITLKQPISAQTTTDGNQLLWVKISDNPNINEPEPEVLYSALHHAREPAGLSNLIYYMWYLLENYATNTEIQTLVDNTEMYFVPCINPDGYMYNELTDPLGGGLWRKNRLDNLDGTFGVDLNRNYGWQWGYDDTGSSPFTVDETYRGSSAFSEVENQTMQNFCNSHDFKLAFNYHTFGNLLIYPWGYVPDFYTPDSALLVNFGSLLTTYNSYTYGTANQTVNYITNGSSDDWMYGEQTTKNKIFAMTPEASTSGFWPANFEIVDIAKDNMFANITLAKLAGKYGVAQDASPKRIGVANGYLNYALNILGLDTSSSYTVSITPVSANMAGTGAAKVYSNVNAGQIINDSISFSLAGTIQPGDQFTYALTVNNGLYITTDTVTKVYGTGVIIFSDNASNISNWTVSGGGWNTTTEDFTSAPTSITDSPFNPYNQFASQSIVTANPVVINNASRAWLTFKSKWQIENNFDYAQVAASINNGVTWTPLCGKYTNEGTIDQDFEQPVYDGFQNTWVTEDIDLDAYIGQSVKFRFYFQSDGFMEYDGFYFDDFKVEKIPSSVGVFNAEGISGFISAPMPNPSIDITQISYSVVRPNSKLKVVNVLGEVVLMKALNEKQNSLSINVSALNAGAYSYFIESANERLTEVKRMLIVK